VAAKALSRTLEPQRRRRTVRQFVRFSNRQVQKVDVGLLGSRLGRLGDLGSIPGRGERIFSLASVSRPALGSSLLYNGYRGSFPGSKARPGSDADHSPPSSSDVENE
jgi:hypothetical protein